MRPPRLSIIKEADRCKSASFPEQERSSAMVRAFAQVARRELGLEAAINRLDRFHLLILDDLAYVTKDQAKTSVLFELISARYERRSMLITAN